MTQFHKDTIIHLVAGGVAGTVGAIVTCPLEVVKTRLQSSSSGFTVTKVCLPKIASSESCSSHTTCKTISPHQRRRLNTFPRHAQVNMIALAHCGLPESSKTMGLMQCIRHIVETEGPRALFKGLGPNLVGVAPSRAIYFCAYSQTKSALNSLMKPDTAIVHVLSASCAGFVACTATNPIWFVKTRLQLDYTRSNRLTALQCIKRIYVQKGLLGFYKGITASYWGVSETVVHFVIYEAIKARLIAHRMDEFNRDEKTSKDFLEFMMAGAVSKTIASCIAYPHEVARTRLREEGNKYRGFWQTLRTVYTEEGHRGLYRGLATQLVRQIPNTAIMMATYEAVVYLLTSYSHSSDYYEPTNR